jgi:hypothetical protein
LQAIDAEPIPDGICGFNGTYNCKSSPGPDVSWIEKMESDRCAHHATPFYCPLRQGQQEQKGKEALVWLDNMDAV